MRCLTCHYDLAHLSEHRCPECGGAFDPNDPLTFSCGPKEMSMPIWLGTAIAIAAVFGWMCFGLFVLAMR